MGISISVNKIEHASAVHTVTRATEFLLGGALASLTMLTVKEAEATRFEC